MINKTDLRIGNSVMLNGEILTVKAIEHNPVNDKYYIKVYEDFRQILCDFLEPIPITEEALVKMGAVSNPYQDRYELHGVNIECNKTRGTTELWIEFMPHVNSIHRLQNFIYSLKNIELTYD